MPARIIETRAPVQNADVTAGEPYRAGHPYARALVDLGGIRAVLAVPLLNDGVAIGMVAIYRQEVGAFSDKQIVLLQNFAAQAVIAMENARLLTEQREALDQQTATAEVLQVINASPGNLRPVFDAMLEKAMRLCDAAFGSLYTYDGERFHSAAQRGVPAAYAEFRTHNPPRPLAGSARASALETKRHSGHRSEGRETISRWQCRHPRNGRTRWHTHHPHGAPLQRRGSAGVYHRSTGRKCGRSPRSRYRCWRILPPRP